MTNKSFDYYLHRKFAQRGGGVIVMPINSNMGECEFCGTGFKLPPNISPQFYPKSQFFHVLKMTGETICYSCLMDGLDRLV